MAEDVLTEDLGGIGQTRCSVQHESITLQSKSSDSKTPTDSDASLSYFRRAKHKIKAMSSEEYVAFCRITGMKLKLYLSTPQNETQIDSAELPKSPTEPTQSAGENRKRPRLDFSAAMGGRERKRGKSMFGLLVGTLNKAKIEDKERNASEAVSWAGVFRMVRGY